jgi:hypothetical protein
MLDMRTPTAATADAVAIAVLTGVASLQAADFHVV